MNRALPTPLRGPLDAGGITVWPPVVLAPMEGVTDRPFRTCIRALGGAGLTVTEFVSSEAMTREVRDAWRMAELDPAEKPVSIQIYGRDPERMAQAARHCQALGASLVDINLGCPSKAVTSGCAGSALLREPALATEIFHAVAGALTIPFTVKMRLGWDHTHYSAPAVARAAQDAGAVMVTVHGRTRSDGYKGHARWDLVGLVREAITVPLLVNGDIVDSDTARLALEQSGADGVMVGRAVLQDPWVLRRIAADLFGCAWEGDSHESRRALLHDYLDRVEAAGYDGGRAVGRLRRIIASFSRGFPGAAHLRAQLNGVHSLADARRLLDAHFRALDADQAQG
jgi:tRNA-dihydrouridine synthase B